MADALYWKHLLVRTPLEEAVKKIRHAAGFFRRLKHPELREIYLEPDRVDRVIARLLTPASNCIDVGCHIGSTLSHILKLAPLGRHQAFEPVPGKAAWLRGKFPEVDVKQVALSDEAGGVTFTENLSRPGFSGFRAAGGAQDRTRQITVTCERLDRLVPTDYRVDFLKVDVEGAELLVLRGASQILRRDHPALLFESAPDGLDRFGMTRRQLYSFLADLGYSVFRPKDYLEGTGPIDFATFDASHLYPFRALNYLALKSKE